MCSPCLGFRLNDKDGKCALSAMPLYQFDINTWSDLPALNLNEIKERESVLSLPYLFIK